MRNFTVFRYLVFGVLTVSVFIIARSKIYSTLFHNEKQKLHPEAVYVTNKSVNDVGRIIQTKYHKMVSKWHTVQTKTPIPESNDNQIRKVSDGIEQSSEQKNKDLNKSPSGSEKSKMADISEIQISQSARESPSGSEKSKLADISEIQNSHSELQFKKKWRFSKAKYKNVRVDVIAVQLRKFKNMKQNKSTIYLMSKNKNGDIDTKQKYGNFSSMCKTPNKVIEDLFCMNKLPYLEDIKNPCWYEGASIKTIKLKCLPYFVLLGCGKCASTDLYARLTKHPQIYRNNGLLKKESLYWSWHKYGITNFKVTYPLSFDGYVSDFNPLSQKLSQLIQQKSELVHKIIIGDASPPDFWDFRAWPLLPQNAGLNEPKVFTPQLMQYVLRNPKFILLFRNPTDRLFSDFYFVNKDSKLSVEDFHSAVISSISVINQCLSQHSVRFCFFSSKIFTQLQCRIHYGCYSVFLKEWLSVFKLEQFYFARTEDYSKNVQTHLEDIFTFLGVDELSQSKYDDILDQKKTRVTKSKSKLTMLNKTREILDSFYETYNQELAQLLSNEKYLWLDKGESEGQVDKFLHPIL